MPDTDAARGLSQDHPAVVVPDVLTGAPFDRLLKEFAAIRASDYEPEDKPNALTFGTYWMPAARMGAPRNRIEAYIARVQESEAFKAAAGGVTFEGAEWWWQDTACGDAPKDYHTDCDLCIATDDDGATVNTKVHPTLSSVFYCSATGGPTVVFDQITHLGDLVPSAPSKVVVSFPRPAQLLLFHGSLWHGVLGPVGEWTSGDRVTLLVNWWTARPNGPSDLPDEFVFNVDGGDDAEGGSSGAPPVPLAEAMTPAVCPGGGGVAAAMADYEAHRVPEGVARVLDRGTRAVVHTWEG